MKRTRGRELGRKAAASFFSFVLAFSMIPSGATLAFADDADVSEDQPEAVEAEVAAEPQDEVIEAAPEEPAVDETIVDEAVEPSVEAEAEEGVPEAAEEPIATGPEAEEAVESEPVAEEGDDDVVLSTADEGDTAAAYEYEGEAITFVDSSGATVEALAPQNNTTVVIAGEQVVVDYYPAQTGTYVGFYLNADVSDATTWDQESYLGADASGNFHFTLEPSACGYAWPVALVDSEGVAASQMYLCVPKEDYLDDVTESLVNVTFVYNYEGAEPDSSVVTVQAGTKMAGSMVANPTREGYEFRGWNTAADGSGTDFTSQTVVNAEMAVYAQWQEAEQAVSEFVYDGDDFKFANADDTKDFGMLSPQDGTTYQLLGDKLIVHLVPSNKTIYAGFYLGADIDLPDTWLQDNFIAAADDGIYDFELPISKCGYAWPIAPAKRSDLTATTAAQYFLYIPPADKIDYVGVSQIPFEGDTVQFVKENLTDTFGMLSSTDLVVSRSNGKVHITFTPSNQSVYAGFYLGTAANIANVPASGTEGATYPVAALSNAEWVAAQGTAGKFTYDFELDESYCGYAWPVAPIKTEAKKGGTTGAQYYITIPAADKIPVFAEEFDYDGSDLFAGNAEGKVFGMYTPQAGTEAVTWNDSVIIDYYPKNTTTYAGFYLDASIGLPSTWNEDLFIEADESGNFHFDLPQSYCGKAWPIAPVKKSDPTATTSGQNYLYIPAADKLEATEADTYTFTVSNTERMWKVVKAELEDNPAGDDYLTIYLSGASYGWAFLGSQDEAVASYDQRESDSRWAAQQGKVTFDEAATYGTYDGGTATATNGYAYRIPVNVAADGNELSYDVVFYATDFTARHIDLDLDAQTAIARSASDVAALTVTSELAELATVESGSLGYTGYVRPYAGNQDQSSNPLSNDFVGDLAINVGDRGIYDQAYAVTYEGAPYVGEDAAVVEPADSDYAEVSAAGDLLLGFYNEYDTTPKTTQLNGNVIKVMMHVAEDAPYLEAGTWVERTFQLDFTSRTAATLAISGEALTPAVFAIAAVASPAKGGTIVAAVDGQAVTEATVGSTVSVTVEPATGYKVTEGTFSVVAADGTAVAMNDDGTFTMPAQAVTVSQGFELAKFRVAKNIGSNGNVILVGSDGQVAGKTSDKTAPTMNPTMGAKVYFKTAPTVPGYTLSTFNVKYTDPATGKAVTLTSGKGITRVSGTGKAGTSSVYCFTMPATNVTLSATFAVNKRPITKSITGTGKTGSNLMLVGSDGKVAGQTKDKVAPTMNPQVGQKVYFKSVPAKGAKLTKFNVTFKDDATGKTVKWTTGNGITKVKDGLYCFTMPNYNVTLTGEFTK